MAITISGQNNNDKIIASDGVLDSISGFNVVGVMTAANFDVTGKTTTGHLNIGSNIQIGNAGIITATTLIGNVTGNINHTSNLLLQISGSEKFRVGTSGQLGIGGANYGTSGQVLTSGGSGSAATWSTITGTTINNNADNRVITGSGTANTLNGESGLVYNGYNLAISGTGQQQLNVGSTNAGGVAIILDGDSNGDAAGGDYSIIRHNTDGDLEFFARGPVGATNTIFRQGTSEKVRIDAGGNMNVTGVVTATSFSGSGANLTGLVTPLSFRNIVVNGAMTISQRGTSSTSNGYTTVDRITPYTDNIGVTATYSQVDVTSGGAYDSGFRKAWQVTKGAGTANTNSQVNMGYKIEAQDIANSGWKYTDPNSFITFSFWVKTSVSNHNPQVLIQDKDTSTSSTKFFVIDIPTLTANTWTKITQTIPGHANQVYNNDNGNGLEIQIIPWYGTDYTDAGNTTGAWTSFGTKPVNTTWLTTNGSTFQITGLQLEVGSVATPFEHRSYTEEFTRCQRYYQKDLNRRAYWGSGNVSDRQFPVRFGVEMRDTPTVSFTSTSLDGGSAAAYNKTRQGYNFAMTGNGRFYEWQHTASAEI